MTSKKVLVVFGATGVQGGSVARSVLADPTASKEFHIKAVTRDPSKPTSVALARLGAELVIADMEDKDSLRAVLEGAYGVFLVTLMENFDYVGETRKGMNVVDICKETDIKHLVWSSLPYISKFSNGKYPDAVHFDGKAVIDDHVRALGVPHTIVHVGTYISYLLESFAPQSTDPRKYTLSFPKPASLDTELPLIDASADVGKFVKAILLNPERSLGELYNLAYRFVTIRDFVQTVKANGVDLTFQAVEKDEFKGGMAAFGLPEFFQEDVAQVISFGAEFGFQLSSGEVEKVQQLVEEPLTSLEESLRSSAVFAGLKGE
ncbi:nmrA family transcriptional regulator [Aspergillus karnatakaensis]|uniref:NmrA/HSCARG family protein n=1 Tax=Aspergillus karnatakaensis TaxID=1810916 RepID=UPI003CCE51F3